MSKFGRKFTCWKCSTKFYDLKKPNPKCPKCGANPEDDPHKGLPVAAPPAPGEDFSDEVEDEIPEDVGEDEEIDEEVAEDDAAGSDSDEY